MQQISFADGLRKYSVLRRRTKNISWQLTGEERDGYLGVLMRYTGIERLYWIRKSQYDDTDRYPSSLPLYRETIS